MRQDKMTACLYITKKFFGRSHHQCNVARAEGSNYCEEHRPNPHSYFMRTGIRHRDASRPRFFQSWFQRGFNIRVWELILMCIIAGIGGGAFNSIFGG